MAKWQKPKEFAQFARFQGPIRDFVCAAGSCGLWGEAVHTESTAKRSA